MDLNVGQLAELIGGELRGPADKASLSVGTSIALSHSQHTDAEGAVCWDLGGACASATDHRVTSGRGVVTSCAADFPESGWQIIVADVSAALRTFAAWKRKQFAGEVVAIAGPIGKSTTRRMIAHLAELKFPAAAIVTQAEVDPDRQVEFSLANLGDEKLAILECWSSNQVQLCDPTIAVLTSHPTTAGFGRETAVADTTLAALSAHAKLVLPGNLRLDDDATCAAAQTFRYGREADCDIVLRNVTCGGGKLSFEIDEACFSIPVWGRHHAPAAAAAIAVARAWNVPFLEIVTKLGKFSSHALGCPVFHHANMTFIKDTRHGGRDSHRAALELLREVSASANGTGRRVIVCDKLADDKHRETVSQAFGEQVVSVAGADVFIVIGDHSRQVALAAREAGMSQSAVREHIDNTNQQSHESRKADEGVRRIAQRLAGILRSGDSVLFKASPAGQLDDVIAALQQENNNLPLDSLESLDVLPTVFQV